jgi:sporulation protein YlmC with PRC-barrel domain
MKRVSELIGMAVYTAGGAKKIGTVQDAIIDLQKGEVSRLSLEPIHASNKLDAAKLFREKTILYKNVKAAEKIIIVSEAPTIEEPEAEVQPEAPKPYTAMRYRYMKK